MKGTEISLKVAGGLNAARFYEGDAKRIELRHYCPKMLPRHALVNADQQGAHLTVSWNKMINPGNTICFASRRKPEASNDFFMVLKRMGRLFQTC